MKKVFVTLANKKYIPYSKSLFYNVKDKWDGDFLLMVPEEDKDSYDFTEFTDKGIGVFFAPTIRCEHPDFYKFHLFTEYFTKWDWVFYSDLDVLFFNEIDLKLEEREKPFYAKEDNLPFDQQFSGISKETGKKVYKWLESTENDELMKFDRKKSFQACYMLLNPTVMVENNTFQKLMKAYYEYHVFHDITNDLTLAQSVLNIPIDYSDLGDEFINLYQRYIDLNWDENLLKEEFRDERDYENDGIISVHFGRYSAQWDKNNLRFYPIWKEYNDRF